MRFLLLATVLLAFCYTACRPDESFVEGAVELRLEMDTLRFDTVFTQVGSITRSVKIYNDLDDVLVIDDIRLRTPGSFYRLNVDGFTTDLTEIRIEPNDSIYLFCEVTVDPDQPLSVSPFYLQDYVDISVNGSLTSLVLEAYGQNANYIQLNNPGSASLLSCDFGQIVWDDPKPYVIYGILVIDSCELVLPPGTDVYLHGGLVRADSIFYSDGLLVTLADGRVVADGTLEEPVTIQSDRLESAFDEVSGQWNGIRLLAGSRGNSLVNTIIEHPITGIFIDSSADLTIEHSIIRYAAAQGLVARNATMSMTNCLIHSTGSTGVQLTYGGSYDISYSTIASYNNQAPGLAMANNFCLDPLNLSTCRAAPLQARIVNTVVAGNEDDEVLLSDITNLGIEEIFDYSFDHCVLMVEDLADDVDFTDRVADSRFITRRDTVFASTGADDYRPDSLSVLEGAALAIPSVLLDLEGNTRDMVAPDIGSYEYQY